MNVLRDLLIILSRPLQEAYHDLFNLIQFNKLYSERNITENIKIFLQILHDHN